MLHFGLVGTGFFGKPNYDGAFQNFVSSRDKRYKACVTITKNYLSKGHSVVVEGNFSLKRWRSDLMRYCRITGTPIVVVRCWCSRPEEIARRYQRRKSFPFSLDKGAAFDAYVKEERVEIPLRAEELVGIQKVIQLQLDTGKWSVKTVAMRAANSLLFISQAIAEWAKYEKANYD